MPTNLTSREETRSGGSTWFGIAGPVCAWFALGLGDMFVTWRACISPEQFGGPSFHPIARILYFIITFSLFGVALVAGNACYQNWRRLTGLAKLSQAEGRERNEFMALAGHVYESYAGRRNRVALHPAFHSADVYQGAMSTSITLLGVLVVTACCGVAGCRGGQQTKDYAVSAGGNASARQRTDPSLRVRLLPYDPGNLHCARDGGTTARVLQPQNHDCGRITQLTRQSCSLDPKSEGRGTRNGHAQSWVDRLRRPRCGRLSLHNSMTGTRG